jgi:hypothetical protein
MKGLILTHIMNEAQYKNTQNIVGYTKVAFVYCSAECRYSECRYTGCRGAVTLMTHGTKFSLGESLRECAHDETVMPRLTTIRVTRGFGKKSPNFSKVAKTVS